MTRDEELNAAMLRDGAGGYYPLTAGRMEILTSRRNALVVGGDVNMVDIAEAWFVCNTDGATLASLACLDEHGWKEAKLRALMDVPLSDVAGHFTTWLLDEVKRVRAAQTGHAPRKGKARDAAA